MGSGWRIFSHRSNTTSFAFLSFLHPRDTVWRNSPPRGHSAKDISQTSFGFIDWTFQEFGADFRMALVGKERLHSFERLPNAFLGEATS